MRAQDKLPPLDSMLQDPTEHSYQGNKAPASLALRVTGTHKLFCHSKAPGIAESPRGHTIPVGASWGEHLDAVERDDSDSGDESISLCSEDEGEGGISVGFSQPDC
ncbi:unnamed protein product [Merluccius merluccius]